MITFYKWMLVLSLPTPLLDIAIELEQISAFGLAHGGGGLLLLVLVPSTIAFYVMMVFQCIVIVLFFVNNTGSTLIRVIVPVVLFQLFHLGNILFQEASYGHFMNIPLSIMDIIFFVLLVIYVAKSMGANSTAT
jgi:hypothetical protein